jgi:hypothetical protein
MTANIKETLTGDPECNGTNPSITQNVTSM